VVLAKLNDIIIIMSHRASFHLSFRFWASFVTLILVAVVVYFGWNDVVAAFKLMSRVNLWIFALILPVQVLSYFAASETMYSYLRQTGDLKKTPRLPIARMTLESNFINHVIPVPGVAGLAYCNWVLRRFGVKSSRSTMAQVIRTVLMFISFTVILSLSVLVLMFIGKVNKAIVTISVILAIASIVLLILLFFIFNSQKRVLKISSWTTRIINKVMAIITRGHKKEVLNLTTTRSFFIGIYKDYVNIRRDRQILVKPFLWAGVGNILDASLIWITFLALGSYINPAILFIAFGLSSIASAVAVTPGGMGVYEAIMIAFLASTGTSSEVAIAGTLLARATLLLITIIFGYISYQLTINKYGRVNTTDL
jgi:uncharacterized protein (TIRG00374 family)